MRFVKQEFARQALNDFIKQTKTKQKDISEATGVPSDVISKFKNNYRKQILYDDSLNALMQYLAEKGYSYSELDCS